jgi:hypothetical protein
LKSAPFGAFFFVAKKIQLFGKPKLLTILGLFRMQFEFSKRNERLTMDKLALLRLLPRTLWDRMLLLPIVRLKDWTCTAVWKSQMVAALAAVGTTIGLVFALQVALAVHKQTSSAIYDNGIRRFHRMTVEQARYTLQQCLDSMKEGSRSSICDGAQAAHANAQRARANYLGMRVQDSTIATDLRAMLADVKDMESLFEAYPVPPSTTTEVVDMMLKSPPTVLVSIPAAIIFLLFMLLSRYLAKPHPQGKQWRAVRRLRPIRLLRPRH